MPADRLEHYSALKPVDARILEILPDGSGRVEIPIVRVAQRIDLERTATKAKRVASILPADLAEMVANFAKWPGPVPIHRDPHRSYSETAGPAEGFIEALAVRGDVLWARCFLIAEVMRQFAAQQWRGFSADIGFNLGLPTIEIPGWSVMGGVLTNRPALDVTFRIAAGSSVTGDVGTSTVSVRPSAAERSPDMELTLEQATVQLATAQAESKTKDGTIAQLSADLKTSRDEVSAERNRRVEAEAALEAANAERDKAVSLATRREQDAKDADKTVANLESQLRTERGKVTTLENEKTAGAVLKLCREGVRRGAPPSFFGKDGFATVEADPVAWYTARFSSLQALEDFVGALPKTANLSSVQSGVPGPDDDSGAVMDQDRRESLAKLGLDPRFATVTSESEFNKLRSSGK